MNLKNKVYLKYIYIYIYIYIERERERERESVYEVGERNKVQIHPMAWMDLENMILRQKDK